MSGFAASAKAQDQPPASTQTILILPFDNASNTASLEWISEAFPEILGQRLATPTTYVISRDDRYYAFDRMGIPKNLHASRATLYRIAEQMDADYVILGDYSYNGETFTAHAQLLDMKQLHLTKPFTASGPLINLVQIQSSLAWQILKTIRPQLPMTHEEFMQDVHPIRLDAFENYIRALLATTQTEKIQRLKDAIQEYPEYTAAILELGKTYFNDRQYEPATVWLTKVPLKDKAAGEANFLAGRAYYYLGQFNKSEAAFKVTEASLPLTEVYNNLGVVASRLGKRTALGYFQKTIDADPHDPDYHFNMAIVLYKKGDTAGAARNLRETLAHRPSDTEARQFLDSITGASANSATGPAVNTGSATPGTQVSIHIPLPRLKQNYDETSYRQLALEVQNAMEKSLANADPKTRSKIYTEQGMNLLDKGLTADADREFHEAVVQDPTNALAHAGIASVAESRGDAVTARSEANSSIQLSPNVEAYLVLARLDLKENNLDSASRQVEHALALQPSNAAALSLKRAVDARRARPSEPSPRN